MLESIPQNEHPLEDFQQFPSFHDDSSSPERQTSNLDQSFYSRFIVEASLVNKQNLLKIVQLVLNCAQSRLQTFSLFKLRENLRDRREIKCMPPTSTSLQDDYSIEIPNYPNNPQVGFLGLQSKFSQMDKIQTQACLDKKIYRQMFIMKLENQQLKAQVSNLKEEVIEANRIKQKEVMKKQQSLVVLMQELMDKNQDIEELKSTICLIEGKVNDKRKKIMVQMLDEDKSSLRRSIARLEAVNDRLNHSIEQAKKKIAALESHNTTLNIRCQQLQEEVKRLKEINFDLEANRQTVDMMRKEAMTFSKRFTGKIQSVKRLQKKLSLVVKSIQLQDSAEFKVDNLSEVKTAESTCSIIKRTSSIKQQSTENKLEAIFNFLFHIAQEDYQFMQEELFDPEEKELLVTHKQLFNKCKGIHNINKDNLIDCSEIFGNTLDEALNQGISTEGQTRKKLEKLELQCQNLVASLCALKHKQLYYRQVILKFLKVLNLQSMKKDTESVLATICDMFQYSQTEKSQIFPPKSHKLFGFI